MVRQALMIAATVTLVACQKAEPAKQAEVSVRSEAQDRLFTLSPMNRDIAMRRAITGIGYRCSRVTYSGYVGQYENLDQWTAGCDDDRAWALFIGADDSVQVRDCRDVEEAGLPACTITDHDSRDQKVVKDTADG